MGGDPWTGPGPGSVIDWAYGWANVIWSFTGKRQIAMKHVDLARVAMKET